MMLHDIPGTYTNHYEERQPAPDDAVLSFSGSTLLMGGDDTQVTLPTIAACGLSATEARYLFAIDGRAYFLAPAPLAAADEAGRALAGQAGIDAGQSDGDTAGDAGFAYRPLRDFRWIAPRTTRFAVEVGWQLSHWYADNRFCGRCGTPTEPDHVERMLRCPRCGNTIYPKISPGIIVGIIDGDRLLLTRYAGGGYRAWALVAGFTEIGEPLEDTVRREVAEEVGLSVKNITYFGNQPWMRSASLLVGFFADLDGDAAVTVGHTELAEAAWVSWDQVPHEPDDYILTRAMMCAFHAHHDHPERLVHRPA